MGRLVQPRQHSDVRDRITIPAPGAPPRANSARVAPRNLHRAVLLLARKVEALGVDITDITELLGSDETP